MAIILLVLIIWGLLIVGGDEQVEYRKKNMTEKELSRYFWLKKEVKHIEDQLEEFGSGVSAISFEEKIGSS